MEVAHRIPARVWKRDLELLGALAGSTGCKLPAEPVQSATPAGAGSRLQDARSQTNCSCHLQQRRLTVVSVCFLSSWLEACGGCVWVVGITCLCSYCKRSRGSRWNIAPTQKRKVEEFPNQGRGIMSWATKKNDKCPLES